MSVSDRKKIIVTPIAWLLVFIYGALCIGLFYDAYSLMVSWWNRDDFNYCYLIPFLVLYLLWEKKDVLTSTPSKSSWVGIVSLGFGIALYWLGELGGEYYTLFLSSWFVVIGLCWLHLGWEKLKKISFPLAFSFTMFPLPEFFYSKISVNLKLISSKLGVDMLQLYGMSAYREGNVIDLGFTQLQVVDACSGLRYLISLIVLGILLAYFFKAPLWKRIVLVISTIPLSIFTNGLRIASVGILYQYWGPVVAEGFFHDFSGWFIFMVTLGMLLVEMWILKKIPIGHPLIEEKTEQRHEQLEKLGEEDGVSALSFFRQPQFIVAASLLGLTLALSQGIEFREKIPISKSFDQFPLEIGQWQGSRQEMEQIYLDALDLNDYVIVDFKDKLGKNVNFYVAYYESQRKGESIHSPATCLPGSGWVFNVAGGVPIPIVSNSSKPMPVNRAFMQKGDFKQLSYYWFPQRGRVLTNAYQLKLFAFWDALTRQRTDGALVRVITPVYQSENLEDAEERLQSFVGDIVPVLSEFIPE